MSPSVRRPSSAPATGALQWYVIQVQSGREEAVRQALERRLPAEGLDGAVGRIIVPVETVVESRRGRRVERTRKLFPGYVVCEVALDDRVLALFRETPGVNDFVRSGAVPIPLTATEVERLLAGQSDPTVKVVQPDFEHGDRVRILRGTFAQLEGDVADTLPDAGQVRVRLTILDRPVFVVVATSDLLPLAGRE
jgi:transcriptional antiterminator NusG